MTERFKRSWRGWISSSDGYAIRAGSRTGIDYRDGSGQIRIDSGWTEPWNEIVVYTGSIPNTDERPKSEVLDRLRRAFDFAGWTLTEEDAYYPGTSGG